MSLAPLIDIANRHSDKVAVHNRNNLPAALLDFKAGAAITPYRIVKFATAAGEVIHSAAVTDAHIGVYQGDIAAAAGEDVAIGVDGVVEVEAGAAITQGATLGSDTSGRAVATTTATHTVWATALQSAAAAGDIIKARIGSRAILA